MNWIYNHKRALLHVNLAFIGGLTGAYAILVRGGNFGAAQTMNLIEMVPPACVYHYRGQTDLTVPPASLARPCIEPSM